MYKTVASQSCSTRWPFSGIDSSAPTVPSPARYAAGL